jgi:SAM-dependent methyltransferase
MQYGYPYSDAGKVVVKCPICENENASDYALIGNAPDWEILRCNRDGVEFANALPAPFQEQTQHSILDSFYGTTIDEPSARYSDFVDRVEGVMTNRGIMHDVGCANGQLLTEAKRRSWTVQGNDIVAGLKPRLEAAGINYYYGALNSLNLPTSSCDVVTSFCVLPHHLVDPLPDLRAVWDLLRPGGWFVLEMPDNGPYRRIAKRMYSITGSRVNILAQLYQPGGHQFAFDRTNISSLLQKVGFSVKQIDDYHLDPAQSVNRFKGRPLWIRVPLSVAVYAVAGLSRLLRQSNHMFIYAQKPLDVPM